LATWIRDGRVLDPLTDSLRELDVIVEGERIQALLPRGAFKGSGGDTVFDASGRLVLPGLIDMHVHLREPGEEYKETVATGCLAAVAGGFTSVACMPNTNPANDCRAVTEFILEQARRAGTARVYPVAAITIGRKGAALTEFGDLKAAGAIAVSDDGAPVVDSEIMRRALQYASYHGLMVISHCEDIRLSEGGVMHEGEVSTRIGLPGIPAAAEAVMVQRDICLSELTGCPVHIAHVSTEVSIDMIRRAKEKGIRVSAETAPHYFTLDHSAVAGYNTAAKVNPPLRTPKDVLAVRKALAEGVIDVIATDHAPHSPLEKDLEFDRAAFGMIGLQSALPLVLELVETGVLTLSQAVEKLSAAPARILGIEGGVLKEGAPADLIIVDPHATYVFSEDMILSKSRNSPFIGRTMKGMVCLTMTGGKVVWRRETADPGS
jgi:dihydroorotase